MRPGSEKDYRFLLSRLLPRHLLSMKRRQGIDAALARGDHLSMVTAAYGALEELASRGVFVREPARGGSGSVSLSYRRAGHPEKVTLVMAEGVWNELGGERRARTAPAERVIDGIISSLSLDDYPKTAMTHVAELLALVPTILPGSRGRILFVRDFPSARGAASGITAFKPWDETIARELYRSCLVEGAAPFLARVPGPRAGESFFGTADGTRLIVLFPLVGRDIAWGVLEIHGTDAEAPAAETVANLSLIGRGIVRLIENNSRLETMVAIDRLTGVYNRNHCEMQLPLEIERANRSRKNLAYLILDVDDFKKVNDTFGHDAGDRVLRHIAQTVRSHLRKIDLLFRYGGEEFVVLLPGAGRDSALRTAERIREVVARAEHALPGGRGATVTISIGGCIYPDDAVNELQLLRTADAALYAAKRGGKNRVVFHGVDR